MDHKHISRLCSLQTHLHPTDESLLDVFIVKNSKPSVFTPTCRLKPNIQSDTSEGVQVTWTTTSNHHTPLASTSFHAANTKMTNKGSVTSEKPLGPTVLSAKRVSAFIHCVVLFVQLWCFCWSFYTPTLSPGHDPGSRWKVPIGGRPL